MQSIQSWSDRSYLVVFVVLAVMAGAAAALLPAQYVLVLVTGGALAYLAIRRPQWVMFGLLLTKASLDNLSQTVAFLEGTPLAVNVNGLMNVVIVLWAIAAVVGRYAPLRRLPAALPYMVLLILGLLGLLASRYPVDLLREWFRIASPFAVYVVVSGVARHREGIGWFVGLVALSAMIPLGIGFYQTATGTGTLTPVNFNRAFSTFWYPASLGIYLMMVIMVALPQFRADNRSDRQLVLLALLAACGMALLFTYARAAWIGTMLAVGVFGLFYYRRLLLTGLASVIIITLAVPSVSQRFADLGTPETFAVSTGATSSLGAVNSFQWRLTLWSDTLPFVADNPLVGHGLGSFANLAATTRIGIRIAAHNDYLRMLIETGVLGLLVFLWLHWRVLRGAWQVHRRYHPGWQSMFAIAFIGLYLAVLLVSATDNVLSYHTVGWYVWAYAAVVHRL